MDQSILVSVVIIALGWAAQYGMTRQQISDIVRRVDNVEKDQKDLSKRVAKGDTAFAEINLQLEAISHQLATLHEDLKNFRLRQ